MNKTAFAMISMALVAMALPTQAGPRETLEELVASLSGQDKKCTDSSDINGDMGCSTYECIVGDVVSVGVQEDSGHDVWGDASCGNAKAHCADDSGCSDTGTTPATKAESGDCSGNTDNGWGAKLTCLSGTGNAFLLMELFNFEERTQESCPDIAPQLRAAGFTSVISNEIGGSTTFAWSRSNGCA